MGTLAIAFLIVFVCLFSTTFHFQRFTLGVARGLAPNTATRNISSMQALMSPAWMGFLGWLLYLPLVLSAYFGFQPYGWLWLAGLAILVIVGGAILDNVWPLPTRSQCASLAMREVLRDYSVAVLSHNEAAMLLDQQVIANLALYHKKPEGGI